MEMEAGPSRVDIARDIHKAGSEDDGEEWISASAQQIFCSTLLARRVELESRGLKAARGSDESTPWR